MTAGWAPEPTFVAHMHVEGHARLRPRVAFIYEQPDSEGNGLTKQISLDRFERRRLVTVWGDGPVGTDERHAEDDRAPLLRHEARVIADINKLVG